MNDLEPTTSRRINGVDYALRESGAADGQVLLLLHGLLDTGASFAPLVAAIEAHQPGRFRFVAPDWRGHGASGANRDSYWFPDYLADLEQIIDDHLAGAEAPVILIGHSMGGNVASFYAGLRAHRVSHLVTLDSLNIADSDPSDAPARYRRWLDAKAAPPQPRSYADDAAIAVLIARRYPELDESTHRRLAHGWSQPDGRGRRRLRHDPWHAVNFPYGFRLADAQAIWHEVTARVLCIDAGASPIRGVAAAALAQRHACFAALDRVVLAGCGHMLHLQKPDRVAELICRHVDGGR